MDNQMSPVLYNDGILANVGTMNKLRSYKRAKFSNLSNACAIISLILLLSA